MKATKKGRVNKKYVTQVLYTYVYISIRIYTHILSYNEISTIIRSHTLVVKYLVAKCATKASEVPKCT